MSQAPQLTAELHKLCGKLRDGDMTEAESQRLGEILQASGEVRRFYRTFMALASALETRTSLQASVDQEADSDKNIEVLFDLLHMEQEAEVFELPAESFVPKAQPRRSREQTLGWHEFADASGYLLKQAARSTPAKWLAAAAVIAMGIFLAVQFIGPSAPTPNPITHNTTTEPGRVGPEATTAVATLTATHDAQWTGGPAAAGLGIGDKLHPNTRLTLTAGIAEITTHRGAVAILEAPATIELLDNSNAIRLHAGKLVGICETDSSKGFVVRTPHLDVTDLGTRFGVDVSQAESSEIHVFEGEVQAAHPEAADHATPLKLNAGQSVQANEGDTALVPIDHDVQRFASLLTETLRLPGTGHGLASGQVDPNWQVVAVDGRTLATPQPLVVGGRMGHVRHHKNDPNTSQWLLWTPPAAEQQQAETVYRLQTTLELSDAAALPGARLVLSYMADNDLRAMYINGQQIVLPKMDTTDYFTKFFKASIDQHLKPGKNTVGFDLANLKLDKTPTAGSVGLRIAWELEAPRLKPTQDP